MPRFKNVYCSQCGREFGPGDEGYALCRDHRSRGPTMKFASHCPDGQICGATTTGCLEGKCQRNEAERCSCTWCPVHGGKPVRLP